jgi:hypothetical protein
MWTDGSKAPVRRGDTIFLPLKQAHSLECISEGACAWLGCFILPGLRPLTISGLLKERQ